MSPVNVVNENMWGGLPDHKDDSNSEKCPGD